MGRSFDDALTAFAAVEKTALKSALMNWETLDGLGRDIVRNLYLERFLPGSNMSMLLRAIHDCRSKTLDELRLEYKEACYRNVMQGGTILDPQPVLVGRAVDKESFVQAIFLAYGPIGNGGKGFFPSRLMAEDFVSRLLSGNALSPNECSLSMSEYAAWVTWNYSALSTDPFSFSISATEVRACIGLESLVSKKGEPLLLLVYEKASTLELLRPTVADAGLYKYFEPPPEGLDAHGLTKPWSEDFTPGFRPTPLPEAIHASARFHLLIIPIKEIA